MARPNNETMSVRRIAWTIALPFAMACLAAILLGPTGDVTSEAFDQNQHHLLVIRSFAGQWPSPDLRDYQSATAPLWHLIQSIPASVGMPLEGLRAISTLAGVLLIVLVARVSARLASRAELAWLALPAAINPYTLSGSIWITTDVPATLALTLALALALLDRRGRGMFLAIGTAIRQSGVWMLPSIALVTWFGAPAGSSTPTRARRTLVAIMPALVVLCTLVWIWGGLTPPSYRDQHDRGMNLATPAFTLALVALWGLPLLTIRGLREVRRIPVPVMASTVALGAFIALAVPTSYDMDAGRWGGPLWGIVQRAPAIADRSLVLLVLAPLGAATLLLLVKRAHESMRGGAGVALGLGMIGLIAANTANSQCWERYADLPVMVLLVWLSSLGVRGRCAEDRRALLIGAALLAVVQGVLSAWLVVTPLVRGAGPLGA
ncbi:MAG: hypothetical protein ACO3DS_08870 [Phycisphaerales bacterium]